MINRKYAVGACVLSLCVTTQVMAQTLPGPADIDRIKPLGNREPLLLRDNPSVVPEALPGVEIPESAKQVPLRIDAVTIMGSTVFSDEQLAEIYAPYVKKDVTLDVLWRMAAELTNRYRDAGYFLSRAFVPAQEIDDGQITLKVVEGFIERVELSEHADSEIIAQYIDRLTSQRPLKAAQLESFVLRMNDLPGLRFAAVIRAIKDATPGAVGLVLSPVRQEAQLSVSADNYASRFLGPYQATASYTDSVIPLQNTTLTASSSVPVDELRYGAIQHRVPIYPDLSLEFSGSYVSSAPGATLEPSNIESSSAQLGLALHWQAIRQRQENLNVSLKLAGKNTNGDILGNNPLTRDRIRTAALSADYDTSDGWYGYNYLGATLTQGLNVMGSSNMGDLNLSRAQADPDFTALQLSYSRLQAIGREWMLVGRAAGQYATAPLFSAQEFGYGGQAFGRAYDSSEITGDHGISASLELRYLDIDTWNDIRVVPYSFYDIGRIWNEDRGSKPQSASAAGFGMRVTHASGVYGNMGIAWPLTRDVGTPIYGGGNDPRLIMQLGGNF